MMRLGAVVVMAMLVAGVSGCGSSPGPHPYTVSATRRAFTRGGFVLHRVAADSSPAPVVQFRGKSEFTTVTVRVYSSPKAAKSVLWAFMGATPRATTARNVAVAYVGPSGPVMAALRRLRSS